MHRLAITILAVAPASALGCGGGKTDSASSESTTSEEGSSDEVSRVTVGAYQLEGDEYVDRNADLTYEVGPLENRMVAFTPPEPTNILDLLILATDDHGQRS